MISDFLAPLVFASCELTNFFACLECILQSSACSGHHFLKSLSRFMPLFLTFFTYSWVTTSPSLLSPNLVSRDHTPGEMSHAATLVSLLSRALVGIVLWEPYLNNLQSWVKGKNSVRKVFGCGEGNWWELRSSTPWVFLDQCFSALMCTQTSWGSF